MSLHENKIRKTLVFALVILGVTMARAQRGGGGPGGGGPGGGGMGGPGGGMMGGGGMRMGGDRGNMSARLQTQPIHSEPQLSLPGRWWDDKKTVKAVNLRSDQQERMDGIFNANKGNLMSLYGNLQHEQQKFVSMSKEDLQDETKVFAAIDRVAQARADLEKANFHIVLQLRKEMDPAQVAALDKAIANEQ